MVVRHAASGPRRREEGRRQEEAGREAGRRHGEGRCSAPPGRSERLGMLLDVGEIGGHLWYPEGAAVLLGAQQKDGSWKGSRPEIPVWDTCFAILFLKRATRGLVASGDVSARK